jgi:hypothetical protein
MILKSSRVVKSFLMGHGRIVFEGTPADDKQRRGPKGMARSLSRTLRCPRVEWSMDASHISQWNRDRIRR